MNGINLSLFGVIRPFKVMKRLTECHVSQKIEKRNWSWNFSEEFLVPVRVMDGYTYKHITLDIKSESNFFVCNY